MRFGLVIGIASVAPTLDPHRPKTRVKTAASDRSAEPAPPNANGLIMGKLDPAKLRFLSFL